MIHPFILCIIWQSIMEGIYKPSNVDDSMDAVIDLFDMTT